MRIDVISTPEPVEEFFFLLEKFPDEPKHSYVFTNFLRNFLWNKPVNEALPTVEIMTIIKHEKPFIEMDIKEAKRRLNKIIDKNKQ
jgi:hypothetical protein